MSNRDILDAQRHRRSQIIIISMVAGLASIVIGIFFLLLDNITSTLTIAEPSKKIITQPKTAPALAGPTQPKNTVMPILSQPVLAEPAPIIGSPEDHKKFLKAVKVFSNKAKVEASAFPAIMASARYNDLVTKTESELATLSNQAAYKSGLATLSVATRKLDAWMLADLHRFQSLISKAKVAWQSKRLTKLEGIIATARTIHTGNTELLDRYGLLIADWPDVQNAFQRAKKARVGNEPATEQKALQEISQKTHDISDLKKRIAAVTLRLHQQNVSDLLRQIAQALTTRDVTTTKHALQHLQRLAPKTPEIESLSKDLLALEEDIDLNKVMEKMNALAAADNWNDANQLATTNRTRFYTFERFQRQADFITEVHDLITATKALIAKPEKLTERSAQQRAKVILDTSEAIQSLSPSLASLITKLGPMLGSYTEPLDIIILSDTHTFVEVKSIGQVGKAAKKTIKLLPGVYVLLGKRKGYITIRVPLKLMPGDSGKEITVIAHEQI